MRNFWKSFRKRHPSWNEVIRSRGEMFRWLYESHETVQGRVELVRNNHRIIPAVILRSEDKSFRAPLSQSTPATVLMDVVTVIPFPTPFGYVMPVIFDELADPFWRQICLNLFSIDTIHGVQILHPPAHDPLASRKVVRAFSESPNECGLIVFDQHNTVLFSKLIECCNLTDERAKELAEIMTFLDRFEKHKDLAECTLPQERFTEIFCASIKVPGLEFTEVVPKKRSGLATENQVLSVRVWNNRLLDRRLAATFPRPTPIKRHVFVSHAHADSKAATALADWLKLNWPEIKVYLTKPADERNFQRDPEYFMKELEASKCILYLLTPNSMKRPMVDQEVAANPHKPVVTVMIDITQDQLTEKFRDNLFFPIDDTKIVDTAAKDAGSRLIALLSEATGLSKPTGPFQRLKLIVDNEIRQDNTAAWEQYFHDWETIILSPYLKQSEAEAETLVDTILTEQMRRIRQENSLQLALGFSVRTKLIQCLSWWNNETAWRQFLEQVPALVDMKLVNQIDEMIIRTANLDQEYAAKLRELQIVVQTFARYLAEMRNRSLR